MKSLVILNIVLFFATTSTVGQDTSYRQIDGGTERIIRTVDTVVDTFLGGAIQIVDTDGQVIPAWAYPDQAAAAKDSGVPLTAICYKVSFQWWLWPSFHQNPTIRWDLANKTWRVISWQTDVVKIIGFILFLVISFTLSAIARFIWNLGREKSFRPLCIMAGALFLGGPLMLWLSTESSFLAGHNFYLPVPLLQRCALIAGWSFFIGLAAAWIVDRRDHRKREAH